MISQGRSRAGSCPVAKDKTESRLLLGVGSCSLRGPTGDEIGPLAVPYHDK